MWAIRLLVLSLMALAAHSTMQTDCEVTLYQHNGFAGASFGPFGVQAWTMWAMQASGFYNDQVSSMRVRANGGTVCRVRLFQHADFTGWQAVFVADNSGDAAETTFDFTMAQLQAGGAVNDDMSSMKVEKADECEVSLFYHDNQQGTAYGPFGEGGTTYTQFANDQISSIRVDAYAATTCTINLYQHGDYTGWSATVTADNAAGQSRSSYNYNLATLQALGFVNDDMSAIRVIVESDCYVWLYQHAAFGAPVYGPFGSGDWTMAQLLAQGFSNDQVSSAVVIARRYAVCSLELFQHADFTGWRAVITADNTLSNTHHLFWFDMAYLQSKGFVNDDMSALKLHDESPCTVYLYLHDQFQGTEYGPYFVGRWDMGQLQSKGFQNDQVSSMRVHVAPRDSCTTTLYQHADFTGWSAVVSSDNTANANDRTFDYPMSYLQGRGFVNDDMSSMVVKVTNAGAAAHVAQLVTNEQLQDLDINPNDHFRKGTEPDTDALPDITDEHPPKNTYKMPVDDKLTNYKFPVGDTDDDGRYNPYVSWNVEADEFYLFVAVLCLSIVACISYACYASKRANSKR